MNKLLFLLATLPMLSSAIAVSAGGHMVELGLGKNKIIFEQIKD